MPKLDFLTVAKAMQAAQDTPDPGPMEDVFGVGYFEPVKVTGTLTADQVAKLQAAKLTGSLMHLQEDLPPGFIGPADAFKAMTGKTPAQVYPNWSETAVLAALAIAHQDAIKHGFAFQAQLGMVDLTWAGEKLIVHPSGHVQAGKFSSLKTMPVAQTPAAGWAQAKFVKIDPISGDVIHVATGEKIASTLTADKFAPAPFGPEIVQKVLAEASVVELLQALKAKGCQMPDHDYSVTAQTVTLFVEIPQPDASDAMTAKKNGLL